MPHKWTAAKSFKIHQVWVALQGFVAYCRGFLTGGGWQGGKKLRHFISGHHGFEHFFLYAFKRAGTWKHPATASVTMPLAMLKPAANSRGLCIYGATIWVYGIICQEKSNHLLAFFSWLRIHCHYKLCALLQYLTPVFPAALAIHRQPFPSMLKCCRHLLIGVAF